MWWNFCGFNWEVKINNVNKVHRNNQIKEVIVGRLKCPGPECSSKIILIRNRRSLEKEIANLEKSREKLQNKFATENWDGVEIDKQSIKLQEIMDQIETKTERWFELSGKMEGWKRSLGV